MDLVESAVSLAVSLDKLQTLATRWDRDSPDVAFKILNLSEDVRVAVVALVGVEGSGRP
jgi:hypothetical protein